MGNSEELLPGTLFMIILYHDVTILAISSHHTFISTYSYCGRTLQCTYEYIAVKEFMSTVLVLYKVLILYGKLCSVL